MVAQNYERHVGNVTDTDSDSVMAKFCADKQDIAESVPAAYNHRCMLITSYHCSYLWLPLDLG